jgi:hypothetical protein
MLWVCVGMVHWTTEATKSVLSGQNPVQNRNVAIVCQQKLLRNFLRFAFEGLLENPASVVFLLVVWFVLIEARTKCSKRRLRRFA